MPVLELMDFAAALAAKDAKLALSLWEITGLPVFKELVDRKPGVHCGAVRQRIAAAVGVPVGGTLSDAIVDAVRKTAKRLERQSLLVALLAEDDAEFARLTKIGQPIDKAGVA